MPVSYTHLDVYKRQVLILAMVSGEYWLRSLLGIAARMLLAVSTIFLARSFSAGLGEADSQLNQQT